MDNRYARHELIQWFDQERLQSAYIVVVGAGAVGNEVLKNLALLSVGHVHVFDFDRIEVHNLTRSILFRDSDVGRYKAETAAEACQQINPDISVSFSNMDFWDSLSLAEIKRTDAVICCVDNLEARIRLSHLCLMAPVDYYNTGIDDRYVCVEVYPYATNPSCACYECCLPESAYESQQQRYSCGWLQKTAFVEKKIPTTAITSSVCGAFVTSLVLQRLNKIHLPVSEAFRYFQDTTTLSTTISSVTKNENCYGCGAIKPVEYFAVVNRRNAGNSIFPLGELVPPSVLFSEPVLLYTHCRKCRRRVDYFETTKKLNDHVYYCPECGDNSMEAEIVDRIPFIDFLEFFKTRPVPTRYLVINSDRQIHIELEG